MKLTELARKTIEYTFHNNNNNINYNKKNILFDNILFEPDNNLKEVYKENKASFVTLTINGQLRGCIGSLAATQPLWKDVQKNAIYAAFYDPRFYPLVKEELKDIRIEVSVLSLPEKLVYNDAEDILKKIDNSMGLILKKGQYSATFLPQVWEELPDKGEFLEHLSCKAGLKKDSWKDAEFWYYTIKKDIEEEYE